MGQSQFRVRRKEIEVGIAYVRGKPKYARMAPPDDEPHVDPFMLALIIKTIEERRTRRSKLMFLAGTVIREFIYTNDPARAAKVEALVKAYEAAVSEVFRERKKWQEKLRQRKRAEASENPVTKSGQIRLI